MGCDIHSYGELKEPDGSWCVVIEDVFPSRNYGLFGWLAGVRNYSGLTPIAERRGIPDDSDALDEYVAGYAHSASWLSVAELLAVDYEQIIEDRRCMKQIAPNIWDGGSTCEVGQGTKQTLREFLGEDYFSALQALQNAGAERLVFWFDN